MRLIAGVTNDPNAGVTSGTTYPGTNPVSVNGNRSNNTNYILDGAQNNDIYSNAPNPLPNPDALQEFSVQTNNFSAEFGRQSGGIVNAVTKSGSNEYHGTLFEYVRNNALNAANFLRSYRERREADRRAEAQPVWRNLGRSGDASRSSTTARTEHSSSSRIRAP